MASAVGSCPSSQRSREGASRLAQCRAGGSEAVGALAVMPSLDGALHAFDQVVHLLELDVGLPLRDTGSQDLLAVVALQRALEDDQRARLEPGLGGVGLLLGILGHGLAVGGEFDETLLQTAAHQ